VIFWSLPRKMEFLFHRPPLNHGAWMKLVYSHSSSLYSVANILLKELSSCKWTLQRDASGACSESAFCIGVYLRLSAVSCASKLSSYSRRTCWSLLLVLVRGRYSRKY
jgi:hypothetical protein